MKLIRVALITLLMATPSFSAELKLSPEETKLRDSIRELFEASKKVNDPNPAEKTKARNKIEEALDWERLAITALGKPRWDRQDPKKRKEFQELLHEVVVRTAYARIDKLWGETEKYEFEKVKVTGDKAATGVRFYAGKDEFLIEYDIAKKEGKWKINEIIVDDMQYTKSIAEQIDAFMDEADPEKDPKKKLAREKTVTFPKLLEKVRHRRDELREEGSKGASKSG